MKVVQTTFGEAQRMARLADKRFGSGVPRGGRVIRVDDRRRYQRIAGFGAAMTDTAAWLLHERLAPPARAEVLRKLYGPRRDPPRVMRVPMGASDFTHDGIPYTYADMPAGRYGSALTTFSVARDDAHVVPLLQEVRAINAA